MPQIWLTYDELGDLIGSDVAAARAVAHDIPLDRRKSHDGCTRVKLNAQLIEVFLDQLLRHWVDHNLSTCADELHDLRRRMARRAFATDCAANAIAN